MAGWLLAKCTSTYSFRLFGGGLGDRLFIYTIKKCIYGGSVHFAGRGVGKYLHICRRQPILLLMHVAFFFAIVCEVFQFQEVF